MRTDLLCIRPIDATAPQGPVCAYFPWRRAIKHGNVRAGVSLVAPTNNSPSAPIETSPRPDQPSRRTEWPNSYLFPHSWCRSSRQPVQSGPRHRPLSSRFPPRSWLNRPRSRATSDLVSESRHASACPAFQTCFHGAATCHGSCEGVALIQPALRLFPVQRDACLLVPLAALPVCKVQEVSC